MLISRSQLFLIYHQSYNNGLADYTAAEFTLMPDKMETTTELSDYLLRINAKHRVEAWSQASFC